MRIRFKTAVLNAVFSILIITNNVQCLFSFANFYNVIPYYNTQPEAAGEPLYLTPYIDAGNITEARKAAYVTPLVESDIFSYSGFLTVNKSYNSNLFFWFFINQENKTNAPLLLWLQGGPGDSSLFALFEANGPYIVNENKTELRNNSWTKDLNVLYVDNPIGAGFSFTENSYGYSATVEDAAFNLYEALQQFYKLFPEFLENELFLTGESYAGKYIPTLASLIHERNSLKQDTFKINLKGLFIGCGFIDPINQLYYADYLFHVGIVDNKTRQSISYYEEVARNYITQDNYYRAQIYFSRILWLVYRAGYFIPPVDVLNTKRTKSNNQLLGFLQSSDFRKAIHVGSSSFQGKEKVIFYFRADLFHSVSHYLPKLIENYKVLLYSAQFDMLIPHTQFERVISLLEWNKANVFLETSRKNWYVGDELAGYKKVLNNLQYVMVRNSNHVTVKCQPGWIHKLLKSFIFNE